jgi:16S rRNA G966 N2-methylase RsmD
MASEVHHGDCLTVGRSLAGESVDLVYVDPPFFTQKTHSPMSGLRERNTLNSCAFVYESFAAF